MQRIERQITGGCQCGAVRYALYAPPQKASICEAQFQAGIAQACDDVTKWHTSTRPRARPNWC